METNTYNTRQKITLISIFQAFLFRKTINTNCALLGLLLFLLPSTQSFSQSPKPDKNSNVGYEVLPASAQRINALMLDQKEQYRSRMGDLMIKFDPAAPNTPGGIEEQKSGLCVDNLYTNGCDIDGLTYWQLANVLIQDIPCEGTPPWYHDYSEIVHYLNPGYENTLKVIAAFDNTHFDVWIDFNNDLVLTADEIVLNDALCPIRYQLYEFQFTLPSSLPEGTHVMRFRTNWPDPVNDPCVSYTFGNCCDFGVVVGQQVTKDAGVISLDMEMIIPSGNIIPKATIKNHGLQTQSFDVEMANDGGYSSSVTITELLPGQTIQVEFSTWNAQNGNWEFEVCTQLQGDQLPENDCETKQVIVLDSKTAYSYKAADISPNSPIPIGMVSLDLVEPGTLTSIAPSPISDFIASATWMPGGFIYGITYGGALFEIDPVTGDFEFVCQTIQEMTGLAFDGSTLYASTINKLYKLMPSTGEIFLVGDITTTGGAVISIDFNADGELFGYDINDDTFYRIDKTSGQATAIGLMGYDFVYAQDMSFDKDMDICYLAGFGTFNGIFGGALFIVDVATGAANYIGNFQDDAELSALAIPYVEILPDNDLGILEIYTPVSGPYLSEEETIKIRMINAGKNAQSNFSITYSINGNSPVTEVYPGTVPPSQRFDYTFSTPANLSFPDSLYVLTVCATLTGDENPDNDCVSKEIYHSLSILPQPQNLAGEVINDEIVLTWEEPQEYFDLFEDDFEQYPNSGFIALNNPGWTTWTNQPGSSEDPTASQDQSFSPNQSMKMVLGNDVVYPAGSYDYGKHQIDYKMFLPADNSGWFILLKKFEVNNYDWGGQIYFKSDGTGYIDGGAPAAASFTFNHNTWLSVTSLINLDDDVAEFWLNDELVHSWQWSLGPFGQQGIKSFEAIDYFQPEDATFYIDDFRHRQIFSESFEGYRIKRDGEYLTYTTETSFADTNPTANQHEYCVEAVYSTGESEPVCVVVENTIGLNHLSKETFEIYPNPASDKLFFSSGKPVQTLKILDIYGKEIHSSTHNGMQKATIDISKLQPGIYFLKALSAEKEMTGKFVVK